MARLNGGESYAAIWRERGGAIARGKVVLERDFLRLEGATAAGDLARREIPYLAIGGVRVGRAPDERLNSRPTLLLEREFAEPLQLDVLGPGMLFELADLLASVSVEHRERLERIALVVPLKEGMVERARDLVESGPPFDPAGKGLERHEVFFTDREAVFLFEGSDAGKAVRQLVHDPNAWCAAVRWRPLLDGAPRLARSAYSWPTAATSER
jgi:hypothetical protein